MIESKQSDLGKALNELMIRTGMTPLQTMSAYMEGSVKTLGNHTFFPSRAPLPTTQKEDK